MKLTFAFVLAAVIVPVSDAFLIKLVINLFLPRLLDTACTAAQTALKLQNTANCECDGEFLGLGRGFAGDISCGLTKDTCLSPPNFCARGTFGAELAFGLTSGAKLDSNITGCFNITGGFPPPLTSLGNFNNFCIKMKPAGLKLGSCTVSMGPTECKACNICNDGQGFNFDCSNIQVGLGIGNINITGPSIANCIGLDLGGAVGNTTITTNTTNTTRFFF